MTSYALALKREADKLRARALDIRDTRERILALHRANNLVRKATRAEDVARENLAATLDRLAELGFRSQVHGEPTLKAEDVVDRRAMRFHGGGTGWNHIAMEQAIADSGLEEKDISINAVCIASI